MQEDERKCGMVYELGPGVLLTGVKGGIDWG